MRESDWSYGFWNVTQGWLNVGCNVYVDTAMKNWSRSPPSLTQTHAHLQYLSCPVICLYAMFPEAGQTTGVRSAASIPICGGTRVYNPLQTHTQKTPFYRWVLMLIRTPPAAPRASWTRRVSSCTPGRGGPGGFRSHRWMLPHCLFSTEDKHIHIQVRTEITQIQMSRMVLG